VSECETAWKYFDRFPMMKVVDYYSDILKIYLELITDSWNRNSKI